MVDKYGAYGESDVEALERIDYAASIIQRNMWRYLFDINNRPYLF